jgi:hypothetical protein
MLLPCPPLLGVNPIIASRHFELSALGTDGRLVTVVQSELFPKDKTTAMPMQTQVNLQLRGPVVTLDLMKQSPCDLAMTQTSLEF